MKKVIEIEPKFHQHRLALAGIYWHQAKEQQAVEILKTLVAEDPKNELTWIEVANFYTMRGETAGCRARIERREFARMKKSFKIRFAFSDFYLKTNRPDPAIALLTECLKIEKDSANVDVINAKNSLAKIYLAKRDLEKAKTYAEEIIKESPKNVDAQFTKGTIHLMKGEGALAVTAFRLVVGERPQFIPGYVSLANAHALNKEMNLAFDTLNKALKEKSQIQGSPACFGSSLCGAKRCQECRGYISQDS